MVRPAPADSGGDAQRLARHAQEMYLARVEAWREAHPNDVPDAPATVAEGDLRE